jgi:hypothetical protein
LASFWCIALISIASEVGQGKRPQSERSPRRSAGTARRQPSLAGPLSRKSSATRIYRPILIQFNIARQGMQIARRRRASARAWRDVPASWRGSPEWPSMGLLWPFAGKVVGSAWSRSTLVPLREAAARASLSPAVMARPAFFRAICMPCRAILSLINIGRWIRVADDFRLSGPAREADAGRSQPNDVGYASTGVALQFLRRYALITHLIK